MKKKETKTNKPIVGYSEKKAIEILEKVLESNGITKVQASQGRRDGSSYWKTRDGFTISETSSGYVYRMKSVGANFSKRYYIVNPKVNNKSVVILTKVDRLLYILEYVSKNQGRWVKFHNKKVNKLIHLTTA